MTPGEFLNDIRYLVLRGAPRCNQPACGRVAFWRIDARSPIPRSHLCCDRHMGTVASSLGIQAVTLEQTAALRRVFGVMGIDA